MKVFLQMIHYNHRCDEIAIKRGKATKDHRKIVNER